MKIALALLTLVFTLQAYASDDAKTTMDKVANVALNAIKKTYMDAIVANDEKEMSIFQAATHIKTTDFDIIIPEFNSVLLARFSPNKTALPLGKTALVSYVFGQANCSITVGVNVESYAIVVPPFQDCLK